MGCRRADQIGANVRLAASLNEGRLFKPNRSLDFLINSLCHRIHYVAPFSQLPLPTLHDLVRRQAFHI